MDFQLLSSQFLKAYGVAKIRIHAAPNTVDVSFSRMYNDIKMFNSFIEGTIDSANLVTIHIVNLDYFSPSDARIFMQMTNGLVGASGDSSVSEVIAAGGIPFFEQPPHMHAEYFFTELLSLIRDHSIRSEDLFNYFLLTGAIYYDSKYNHQVFSQSELLDRHDYFSELAGLLLKENDILKDQWNQIRKIIMDQYSLTNNLPGMVMRALARSSSLTFAAQESKLFDKKNLEGIKELIRQTFTVNELKPSSHDDNADIVPSDPLQDQFGFGAAAALLPHAEVDFQQAPETNNEYAQVSKSSRITPFALPLEILNSLQGIMSWFHVFFQHPSTSNKSDNDYQLMHYELDDHSDYHEILFDSGEWDSDISHDPHTGAPIFTYFVFKSGIEVGSAKFYRHPLFCKSENGKHHNIIELTGVLSKFDVEAALKTVEDVCEILPSTLFERMSAASLRAGVHGAIKGTTNVVKYWLKAKGLSKKTANYIQHGLYHTAMFSWHFTDSCLKLEEDMPWAEKITTATYEAAWNTGTLLSTQIGANMFSRAFAQLSRLASKYKWYETSDFFRQTSQDVKYLPYAYDTYNQGLINATVSITVGAATEKTLTYFGKKCVDYFFSNQQVVKGPVVLSNLSPKSQL